MSGAQLACDESNMLCVAFGVSNQTLSGSGFTYLMD